MSLELNLMIEGLHDFEKARRLGSLSSDFAKEASLIYISKMDSEELGVSENDVVEVSSSRGSIKARVKLLDGLNKGLALMASSPLSMSLADPSEYPSLIRVKIAKSSGEPTSLSTFTTSKP